MRDESTLPPEILLLGARQSQEVVLCARPGGKVVPHSAMNLSADMGRNLNLRQVVAEQRKERRANIEHSASGAVLLVPPWAIRTTPTNGIGAMVHRPAAR